MYTKIPYDKILMRVCERGVDRSTADDYISYIYHAIILERAEIFYDYIQWRKTYEQERGNNLIIIKSDLEILKFVIGGEINNDEYQSYKTLIEHSIVILQEDHCVNEDDFELVSRPYTELAREFLSLLIDYKRRDASNLILDQVQDGLEIKDLYLKIFQPCQREIGRLWQMNKISVGQEHFCTAVTQAIMSQLYPQIFSTDRIGKRLIATTICGNLHEIGVRMVVDFLELEGWDTYYLGADTPNESILGMLAQHRADMLAISATLAPQVEQVRELIHQVRQASLPKLKIIVGGSAFNANPHLYPITGADGWAGDAQQAVQLVERLEGS